MRERLSPVLDSLPPDSPGLLLEPMAGQGQMLCGPVGDLGPYLTALDWRPQVGICLDTCHAFAAGHDLAAPGGAAELLDLLAQTLAPGGPDGPALKLVHANDSKDPCGSRRDRHEHIGSGHIGRSAFADLLRHPATEGVAFIVETPGERDDVAVDVAALKRLREAG